MTPEPWPQSLCSTCRYLKVIRSDRGSLFYQCLRSKQNPEYPKYPAQPVAWCRGYERTVAGDEKSPSPKDAGP